MKALLKNACRAAVLSLLTLTAWDALAAEKGLDNPKRAPYLEALKGRKVVFLPIAMGFDLTEGWAAMMRRQAAALGYGVEIRDPNWSTDAGTRALTALISEKPDLLVVHNPDIQSYGRLLKRAEEAGIKVLQLNMESVFPTDSYIGADWIEIGEKAGQALVDRCGAGKSVSTKVAVVQGVPTGAANIYQMRGLYGVLARHPEIKVVSEQAANYDPAKARAIMETVLQQHPDLCGATGVWDSQDAGIGAAVQAAGKADQVFIVTSGGGNASSCENLNRGLYSLLVSYDVPLQGTLINQTIVELLLSKDKAGARKTTYFTPLTLIDRKTSSPRNCWSLDDLR